MYSVSLYFHTKKNIVILDKVYLYKSSKEPCTSINMCVYFIEKMCEDIFVCHLEITS